MKYVILLALLLGFTESKIGKKCRYSSDCERGYSAGTYDTLVSCRNGICQCKPGIEVEYDKRSLLPECEFTSYSLRAMTAAFSFKECNDTACVPNSSCQTIKEDFTMYGQMRTWGKPKKKLCYCDEGFLRIGKDCMEPNHQPALESCGTSDSLRTCDLEQASYCSGGKCVCFDTYFANSTSGQCEPMEYYMKAHNLTEYRVKPYEYCSEDRHCIPGLKCRSFKCHCPSPCTYNSTAEICDCGSYSIIPKTANNLAPILLGIFIGLMIMGFWYVRIMKTYQKFKTKKNRRFSNLETAAESPRNQNSYTLCPVSPATASSSVGGGTSEPHPPAGLSVPSAGASGRQSPVSNDILPSKPAGGEDPNTAPAAPPQASLYGINSPQYPFSYPGTGTPLPEAPPVYTEFSSDQDLPPPYSAVPPYSINPPPVGSSSSSAPPMGSSSSSAPPLPYPPPPSNPTDSTNALPYPSSPSSMPYSPSPTFSPNPTSTSTPYSISPFGAPSAMPRQETESYPAPPENNPAPPPIYNTPYSISPFGAPSAMPRQEAGSHPAPPESNPAPPPAYNPSYP